MSIRPLEGRPAPERGGDGPRRRWSESPIPRVASRRVRRMGAVVPPVLDYALFVVANGTDGTFDLAAGITPTAGDVLLALFASRGTTVTMPTGWTSLASGTSGALDYEVAYLTWTGADDTTGSVTPYYDAPPPAWTSYDGYFDAMVLHFLSAGGKVPAVSGLTTVTGSASQAMPTGTATFNVVGGIRSTDNINTPSVAEPTYAQSLEDVAFWVVGMAPDFITPAVESGTVTIDGGAVNCDWVKFLATWT